MIRLILLRHARAKAAVPGQPDHERPLKRWGREQAAELGRVLTDRGERPDLVLCSTALRTRETWDGIAPALGGQVEVRYLRSLFEGPDYEAIIRAETGDAAAVLVIGHNPFIQDLAASLAADRRAPDGGRPAEHFPPAAFAVLASDGQWRDIGTATMRLLAFVKPEA